MHEHLQRARDELASRMLDPRILGGVLDNGMQWFLRKNSRPENKVLVCLIIKTGSAHEQSGNYGIAHFIEHMLFNGTKSYEGETLIEELQRLGVGFGHDLNAYTSLDHTVYHLEIERSPVNVAKALHTLSEFAFEARLEAAHIEKERPIILEEKRLRSGRGEKYIRLLLEKLFVNTGYERLVIGTDEDITGVQKQDFDAFYGTWYAPENMAVAVVGDIDLEATQREIASLFSGAAKQEAPLPKVLEAIQLFEPEESFSLFTHEETATGGIFFYTTRKGLRGKIAEEDHRDWMNYVVAEALGERCQNYISDNETPISQTQCDYMGEYTRLHDLFTVGCIFGPEHLLEATTFLAMEMERMRRYGPTKDEIARICSGLRHRLEQQIVETDTTPHWTYTQKIMSSFLMQDEIGTPEEDLRLLQLYESQTSQEAFLEVAQDLLDPTKLACIIEMPPQATHEELLASVRSKIVEASSMDISAQSGLEEQATIARFESVVEDLPKINVPEPLDMTKVTLPGGSPCYVKQTSFQKDRFHIRILFEGGDIYLPKDEQGLTEVMLKFLTDGGTQQRSASKINQLLQEKSLSLSLEEEGPSGIGLHGSCKTAEAPLLMELIHDVLFEPAWKAVGWTRAQQYMHLSLQDALANPRVLFSEMHTRSILQDHPSSFLPTLAALETWTPERAKAYYQKTFVGSNMYVSIVSSLSVDMSIALAGRFLSDVPKGPKPDYEALKIPVLFPEHSKEQIMHGANEEKASISMSMPGVHFLDPRRHLYTLAAEVLSDRLRKAVRENMGNTYSIGASHNGYRCLKGGDFSIRFGTGPDDVTKTMQRIQEEVHKLRTGDISEDELTRVLSPRRTQFEAQKKENSFWLHAFIDPWNHIPETYQFDMYAKLQGTSKDELQRFIHEELRTEPVVSSILLPKKAA